MMQQKKLKDDIIHNLNLDILLLESVHACFDISNTRTTYISANSCHDNISRRSAAQKPQVESY